MTLPQTPEWLREVIADLRRGHRVGIAATGRAPWLKGRLILSVEELEATVAGLRLMLTPPTSPTSPSSPPASGVDRRPARPHPTETDHDRIINAVADLTALLKVKQINRFTLGRGGLVG